MHQKKSCSFLTRPLTTVVCPKCEKEIEEAYALEYKRRNLCPDCCLKQNKSDFWFGFGLSLVFLTILGVIPSLLLGNSFYVFGLSIYFVPRLLIITLIYGIWRRRAKMKIQTVE
ncbi:hypothetical protein [Candidatus Lokiarchaeum ossiferum]|uniref:hypothetical protein n=1 Tax=Candidatus Lokiarchaeum ossiferum TaxID=2951803 RepID=UPI00352CF6CE